MNEEKFDFWRNLFFYIVSFIGLMIFMFSIISFVTGFFSVEYPEPPISKPVHGAIPPTPHLHIDVRSLINSGTAAIVGFFLWIFSWGTIQKEHNEKLNEDK